MSNEATDPTAVDKTPTLEAVGEHGAAVDEATAPNAAEATSTASPVRRTLKLVLTLQPREPTGYRVLAALGADGCDPVLHCVEAEDFPAVLAALPALVEQAETRWQTQPRYPAAAKGKAPTGKREARPQPGPITEEVSSTNPTPTDAPAAAPAPPPQPGPLPEPAPTGQLSLFG